MRHVGVQSGERLDRLQIAGLVYGRKRYEGVEPLQYALVDQDGCSVLKSAKHDAVAGSKNYARSEACTSPKP